MSKPVPHQSVLTESNTNIIVTDLLPPFYVFCVSERAGDVRD